MDEKTIEELFPVIVRAYNERNYDYAIMVTWFIYYHLEETKMKLSRINNTSLLTSLEILCE